MLVGQDIVTNHTTDQFSRHHLYLTISCPSGHPGAQYVAFGDILKPEVPMSISKNQCFACHGSNAASTSLAKRAIIRSCTMSPSVTSPTTSARLLSMSSIRIHNESSTKSIYNASIVNTF